MKIRYKILLIWILNFWIISFFMLPYSTFVHGIFWGYWHQRYSLMAIDLRWPSQWSIHPTHPIPAYSSEWTRRGRKMKRQKYKKDRKMKRQKDEKITGAKFILDDLVFFSMESKWMMNKRPITRNCTSNGWFTLQGQGRDCKDCLCW